MNAGRPVLVTTDGSSRSHRVLPHAAVLADALGTRVLLVSVVDEAEVPQAKVDLSATLSRLGIAGDVLAAAAQPKEDVAAAILRLAREADAALVALDSQGHGALHHVLHGSVTHALLRQADRPLLVGGPNLEPPASREPYGLLITTDGSPASEAVLRALAPLLTPDRFEVTLLRVHEHESAGEDNAAALEACQRQLEQARALLPEALKVTLLVREIPRGGGVDTAIIEKALELNVRAIGLSTHGMSASEHVLMGGLATLLLGRSPLPLILARSEV
jgi:nucleotide-binding universal stress UspA family protein